MLSETARNFTIYVNIYRESNFTEKLRLKFPRVEKSTRNEQSLKQILFLKSLPIYFENIKCLLRNAVLSYNWDLSPLFPSQENIFFHSSWKNLFHAYFNCTVLINTDWNLKKKVSLFDAIWTLNSMLNICNFWYWYLNSALLQMYV